ncbi:hypothetical protein X946_4093 [Burkholderia sp. ABCPW 111]|nr:hypothetical protein X946_4093 [Burkholderia sp. ABCPW 111]
MSAERSAAWLAWRRLADSHVLSGFAWRASAGAALACGVLAWGVYVGRDADWGGVERSRTALEAVASREARARRLLAEPSARPASPARAGRLPGERQTPADFALRLAGHADASGLRVRKLERLEGARAGEGEGRDDSGVYAFAISAEGDFGALCRFLSGLAALPALAVPVASSVKRDGGATMLDATLDVWPALPGGGDERPADAREAPLADPFAAMPMLAAEDAADAARLVGVMRDRRSGLALFERGDAAWSVAPGQLIGGGRLARLRADGVTLATHGGGRREMTVGGATG